MNVKESKGQRTRIGWRRSIVITLDNGKKVKMSLPASLTEAEARILKSFIDGHILPKNNLSSSSKESQK